MDGVTDDQFIDALVAELRKPAHDFAVMGAEVQLDGALWMPVASGYDAPQDGQWYEWARIPDGKTANDWGRTFTRADTEIRRGIFDPSRMIN
jgi:hypothetical protein